MHYAWNTLETLGKASIAGQEISQPCEILPSFESLGLGTVTGVPIVWHLKSMTI